MNLTIKTTKLQEMIARAIKGASNNKMIPLTSLIAIESANGKLTLTTTDATNTLKVSTPLEAEDFYVALQADIFSKLIAKTTTENVSLTLKESGLEIKGNGVYNIDLPLDEEGALIRFPEYTFDSKTKKIPLDKATIRSILSANRAALATTMEVPVLTGYYFGEQVITTDSFRVCSNQIKLFPSDLLLPSAMIDLLEIFEEEKINVQISGKKLLFSTPEMTLYGTEFPGIEDFPYEAIKAYLGTEFERSCRVSRSKFLEILDRLTLFVSEYDQNGIYLTFTKDGIWIKSKKSNGVEQLPYAAPIEEGEDFACFIDIELLRSQIMAQGADVIDLWYGYDKALKLSSGSITQVIALLEDEGVMGDGA